MKILFVVPYVPSLIRVRPYNLIRHLSARGHAVTVATVWTNGREQQDLEELRKYCADVTAIHLPRWRSLANCLQALPGDVPLQARYSVSSALLAQVRSLAPRFDVVHVEHLRGAQYGLSVGTAKAASGTPVVWDSVDCITHLFDQAARKRTDAVGRLINRFEAVRTRRFEGWLVSQFDRVLVTSEVDRTSLLGLSAATPPDAAGTPVTVLTNGVDLDYFAPGDEPRETDSLVFSGKMSYHANESAVFHLLKEVMPRVWATRPATRLTVVGKDPSPKLRALLAAEPSRIRVTGTVPDIRPFLRRASAAVAPLVYGAGCQNKVLEAMACATPVVATPQAVSALSTRAGQDALVAAGPEAFAQAILSLLEHPSRGREVGEAGRRYVETHHRWTQIAGRLESIYEEVLAERDVAPHASSERLLTA